MMSLTIYLLFGQHSTSKSSTKWVVTFLPNHVEIFLLLSKVFVRSSFWFPFHFLCVVLFLFCCLPICVQTFKDFLSYPVCLCVLFLPFMGQFNFPFFNCVLFVHCFGSKKKTEITIAKLQFHAPILSIIDNLLNAHSHSHPHWYRFRFACLGFSFGVIK